MKRVCIVGLGNMGSAMREILAASGKFEVSGFDRDGDAEAELSQCDLFVIAVKPQVFEEFASSVGADLSEKVAISIMAGVGSDVIAEKLGVKKVVRAMPNLPLKVGAGLTGVYFEGCAEEDKEVVNEILQCFGDVIELGEEAKVDAITALSGSGPAYFYKMVEDLAEAAQELGFSEEEAVKISQVTFEGSAQLLLEDDRNVIELKNGVISKGGTTEAALKKMDEMGFDDAVAGGVQAALARAAELNKQSHD